MSTQEPSKDLNTPPAGTPPADNTANKELETLKSQLQEEQKQKQKLASDLTGLKATLDQMKKEGLKGNEDYKKLAETYEAENVDLKKKTSSLEEKFYGTLRSMAFKDAAVKLGVRPEALPDLDHVNMDGLEVAETSAGTYQVKGAEGFANEWKKLRPHWFTVPKAPTINNGGGGEGAPITGEISKEQFQEAYRQRIKDPKTYRTVLEKFTEQQRLKKGA
jgi:hypothetical protein